MNIPIKITAEYWQNLAVTQRDIDFLQNHLFETEIPLTINELVNVLVEERIRQERDAQRMEQKAAGELYLPKNHYRDGQKLFFPALGMRKGQVKSVRAGRNPEIGDFEVLTVDLEDGSTRSFAAGLADHKLNAPQEEKLAPDVDPELVVAEYGQPIAKKLEVALGSDGNLVRIAARWFPAALLVDINTGHLNLSEAVLEMSGGEPLPAQKLMEQIDLPTGDNTRLTEFSFNYALQEDGRFDEVGPAGEVLWCLRRLEPQEVQNAPARLQYRLIDYDRSVLTPQMLTLEAELDDELSETDYQHPDSNEVTLVLSYPHWRSGTLPISSRARSFFPTAYESPRVCFTIVDSKTGQKIPAWVVREHGYVYGLKAWFDANKLIPGAKITLKKSKKPGEVILDARTKRPTKDWVRTVLAGSDGGLVFSVLRQEVACEYDDRMVIYVPNIAGVDAAFDQMSRSQRSFERLLKDVLRELSKLTPQGHVHAEELYSAVNILRRVPPAPMLATLASSHEFSHVGDLHYRLAEMMIEEE
jgi:hypothetical protein